MAKLPNRPSESEMEVLKALWNDGPGTVREISDRMQGTAAGRTQLS